MAANLTANEEAQLLQTIEMFEVIAQSQPNDYQSLEILKEAYSKLGRVNDVVTTSKRIAKAYEGSGALSSAILEYESILELRPDDPDVRAALDQINSRADTFAQRPAVPDTDYLGKAKGDGARGDTAQARKAIPGVDDGRESMRKIFVTDGKYITAQDFDQYWITPDLKNPPGQVVEPFLQTLAERQIVPLDKSLKLVCDSSRLPFLPIEKYDLDLEWVKKFPKDICQRWCVLPFDGMSKSVLVATANPFNRQVKDDFKQNGQGQLLWYLASPPELMKLVKKIFR